VKEDKQFDRFKGRVMFSIQSMSGRVLGFGGRILTNDKKAAKYLNSPESDIYHKSKVLYGISYAKHAIRKEDTCFLCEGYTDVISLHQAGVENTVSSSGTALTPDQIKLIKRFTDNITILYDGDAAGIKAALRGVDLAIEGGLNVRLVLLPDGEDPDTLIGKEGAAAFEAREGRPPTVWTRALCADLSLSAAGSFRTRREVKSWTLAAQSYLWEDRLIATLGWRHDDYRARVTTSGAITDVLGKVTSPALTNAELFTTNSTGLINYNAVMSRWGRWDALTGDTKTLGAAFRPLKGLGFVQKLGGGGDDALDTERALDAVLAAAMEQTAIIDVALMLGILAVCASVGFVNWRGTGNG
jgi:hypothetical protein